MKTLQLIMLCLVSTFACSNAPKMDEHTAILPSTILACNDSTCYGTYSGPEFVNGRDVAHQFSNKMAAAVGDKLKEYYAAKKYVKVNLKGIQMSTKGMDNRGNVVYSLNIPFVFTNDSCEAFTSFDHRGGWGHTPNKDKVLEQFKAVKGLEYIFTSTPEGLTEYWLQWKNNDLQKFCK